MDVKPLAWRPRVAWTGVSTYQLAPHGGKVASHVDDWDSISNQRPVSLEAITDAVWGSGLLSPPLPRGADVPSMLLLRRGADYSLRRVAQSYCVEADVESRGPAARYHLCPGECACLCYVPLDSLEACITHAHAHTHILYIYINTCTYINTYIR